MREQHRAETEKARVGRGLFFGLLTLAAVTSLKFIARDALGDPTPFLLYFAASLLAAWFGGFTAGALITAAGGVLANVFFMHPSGTPTLDGTAIAQTGAFILEGAIISLVTAKLARTLDRSRTAARQLETVLQGVEDGITMLDVRGRLIYANDLAARLCGFSTAKEMLATPVEQIMGRYEIFSEDGAAFPLSALPSRAALRGEPAEEVTICFRAKDGGGERWSIVGANPVLDEDDRVEFVVNVFHDITAQRKHEDALRLSRGLFATTLRSIGDAVLTTDQHGKVTFLNPAAEVLTGWPAREAEGRPITEVFSTTERSVVGLTNHTVLVRRDGTESAIDDRVAPIKTENGELVGAAVVFRDVSIQRRKDARKAFLMRATTELNSSLDYEATLATIARLAVPAIADWCAVDMRDGDGVKRLAVAHVDPAKIELVKEIERRYPPNLNASSGVPAILRSGEPEMFADIPEAMIDAVAPDENYRELAKQLMLRSYIGVPIKHGPETSGAIVFVMAESKRRYDEEDLAFAIALGERAAIAIENARLYREAERLRAEAALERDRLEAMIMASPTAICVARGPDPLVFELMNAPYVSRFAQRIEPGAQVSGLAGAKIELFKRVFITGAPEVGNEVPISSTVYADGIDPHYVSYSLQPLRDARGRVDRVVVFANDVTEQVLARKRIEAARAEAELANRAKDEFLAMLGHELRNPLAPILTALDLMNLRAGSVLERERQVIERQVRHVVRLVEDLLDVSRMTRGRVDLSREVVEVAEVIGEAIERSSPLIEERAHTMVKNVEAGVFVDGDRVRLAQIVGNLINNAAKYTNPGGCITISASRAGAMAEIRVKDNGIGIAKKTLERVFELFVQESQALDRAHGGLGVGLAIVSNFVKLHGGTVEAHSEGIGRGSEFVVRLPFVQAPAAVFEPSIAQAIKRGDRKRVLIVDDNADALELLASALDVLDYEVVLARDGASALDQAAKHRPRVALLDIGLPGMDGYELARRMRALEGLEHARLIAVSGYGQVSDRERSHAAGFDEHLVKPVAIESLQAAIERT